MQSIPPTPTHLPDFSFFRFHLDLTLCINLSDIAHLGNSVRILLEGPLRSSEDVPGSFSLKSGVRINRAPGPTGVPGVPGVQQERGLNC